MKNNKLVHLAHSLLKFLSIMGMYVAFVGINGVGITQGVLAQKFNIINIESKLSAQEKVALEEEAALQKFRLDKAQAIDAYFSTRDMPLAGQGMKMVLEAEKNDIDWRLLPAIAVRESTGGKFACKNNFNPFGFGSCKIKFNSMDEAIEAVAKNLGGNHPKTAYRYDGKTTKQILRAYNPPSVVPRYAEQVISIMNAIADPDKKTGFDLLAMANK